MYAVMYKYRDLEPEVLDTADTREEAEYLLDEHTLAYATSMHETELWIDEDYQEE